MSADLPAAAAVATAHSPRQRWVSFDLAQQIFAVDVLQVQEVLCVPPIAPVPGAPPVCLGVINLRGHIIPVLDLRRLLAVADQATAPQDPAGGRLIVIDDQDEALALRVDQVGEVLTISPLSIEAAPDLGVMDCPGQLAGVVQREHQLLLLLDTKALLRHAASSLAGAGR